MQVNTPENSWTFETVKDAVVAAKPYDSGQKALKIIGWVGLVIAGALAVTAVIKFSAVILIPVVVIGVVSVGLIALGMRLKGKVNDLTVDKGLTSAVKAEIAVNQFMLLLEEESEFGFEETNNLTSEINEVSSGRVLSRFNSIQKEEPQFSIDDNDLCENTILDLLATAYRKGVVLHLKSLEKLLFGSFDEIRTRWIDAGFHNERGVQEVLRSSFISAKFIKKCFEDGDVDAKRINKQLDALAVKYIPASSSLTARAVKPSIYLGDENIVIINSRFGEIGMAERIVEELNIEGITIQLQGYGFRVSCGSYGSNKEGEWNAYIAKFTQTAKYKAKVEDHHVKSDDEDIWQPATPRYKMWSPTWNEAKEYLSRSVAETKN